MITLIILSKRLEHEMNGLTQAQRSHDRQEPNFYLEEDASELGDRVADLSTGEIAGLH